MIGAKSSINPVYFCEMWGTDCPLDGYPGACLPEVCRDRRPTVMSEKRANGVLLRPAKGAVNWTIPFTVSMCAHPGDCILCSQW